MLETHNVCLWRSSQEAAVIGLPAGFLTLAPAFVQPPLPVEALMLLPAGTGSRGMLDAIAQAPSAVVNNGIGLFLGDPFLNSRRIAVDLRSWSVSWVSNLPTVAQHDEAFQQDLAEVGFSVASELELLFEYRCHGFKTLAALSDLTHIHHLRAHPVDAILWVQTTRDLQVSFPSLPQRQSLVRDARLKMQQLGIDCHILPLVNEDELLYSTIAAICRPQPIALV